MNLAYVSIYISLYYILLYVSIILFPHYFVKIKKMTKHLNMIIYDR